MPIIEFSYEDQQRGRIVTPAFYRVEIQTVGEWLPSRNGDSNNCQLQGTIIKNADNGSTEFAGVPTPYWGFNDKPSARGFIEGFLRALNAYEEITEPGKKKRFELKSAEGKTLDVFIGNDTYEGRIVNRIDHKYRTPKD